MWLWAYEVSQSALQCTLACHAEDVSDHEEANEHLDGKSSRASITIKSRAVAG